MMNKGLMLIVTVSAFLTSCLTPANVVYFQDAGDFTQFKNVTPYEVYIHQDDLLAIMVNSKATEAATPYNLPMVNYYVGGDSYGQQRLLGYLVDKDGDIDFPILGKLHVEGLTRNKLRDLLKTKLIEGGHLNDPIITINFLNFKVSVQGEVNRPGTFMVSGERITLLEALSMAGDLTIYGRRDAVAVIRESKGERFILFHDLSSADIFNSPCYFLQQNDIVYVEPNKRRIQQSNINQNNNVSVWLSVASVLLTATTFFISLSK
jgi:polysaccharide export outer membrane protein